MNNKDQKTGLNIDESVARTLCYIPVFGVLVSVVFLVLEKRSRVRWDGVQAILLWLVTVILGWMLNVTIVIRGLVPLLNLVGMILVPLVLAIKANKGEETKIPIVEELVNSIAGRVHDKIK